jgi:hypothetical protein
MFLSMKLISSGFFQLRTAERHKKFKSSITNRLTRLATRHTFARPAMQSVAQAVATILYSPFGRPSWRLAICRAITSSTVSSDNPPRHHHQYEIYPIASTFTHLSKISSGSLEACVPTYLALHPASPRSTGLGSLNYYQRPPTHCQKKSLG